MGRLSNSTTPTPTPTAPSTWSPTTGSSPPRRRADGMPTNPETGSDIEIEEDDGGYTVTFPMRTPPPRRDTDER